MKQAVMMTLTALLWSGALQAQGSISTGSPLQQQGSSAVSAAGIDVVVPMPLGGYTNGTNSVNCSRCCLYQDRYYSEGAVVSTEGLLLQCQANTRVLSTNNLRWVVLKKG